MRKSKVAFVILFYCLFITLIFISGLTYIKHYLSTNEILTSSLIYQPSNNDLYNNLTNGNLTINLDKLIMGSDVIEKYNKEIFLNIITISSIFFILILISSIILIIIWDSIKKENLRQIISQLNHITDADELINLDPWVLSIYSSIKEHFHNHLSSYKRLHSYLSHEQKNQIAILKANMEIENNITHLKILNSISDSIDDVLTLSENEDTSNLYEVDTALVCATVCDNYKNLSNITFSFSEDMNTNVLAKERWIYRAISNLVDNAIKYSDGGDVSVHVKNHNNSVIITVEDNGIGISQEQLQKIFEHKYRVNELNKNGYGIGLSLVSHVCNLCGGFVIAESKLGIGTKFYMSFPEASTS